MKAKTLPAEFVKDAEAEEEDIDEEEVVEGEVDGEDEEDYDGEEGGRYFNFIFFKYVTSQRMIYLMMVCVV